MHESLAGSRGALAIRQRAHPSPLASGPDLRGPLLADMSVARGDFAVLRSQIVFASTVPLDPIMSASTVPLDPLMFASV